MQQYRHTAFLVTIIAVFAARPFFGDTNAAVIAFSIGILGMLIVALMTIHVEDLVGERSALASQHRWKIVVAWLLAVPAVVERLRGIGNPDRGVELLGAVAWLLFFGFVTYCLLRDLLRHREVTRETISLSVSVYLMLGMCWALLYIVLFTRDPASFSLGASAGLPEQRTFPLFLYASLGTLSTIGSGDINPLSLGARYASVAEAIAGQFYLAILVARLVGMRMSTPPAS